MKSKKFVVGSIIITVGICLLLSIPLYFLQSHANQTKLLKEYDKQEQAYTQHSKTENPPLPTPVNQKTENKVEDRLLGKLVIPKISLEVPILEGTDQAVLKKGAGHLTASVETGKNGASVIAAHNTTFFHNIGQLKQNDTFQVETVSGTQTFQVYDTKVVKTGDPIYNTETPTLVLETCYPLDTGTLTPYRYLVFTKIMN